MVNSDGIFKSSSSPMLPSYNELISSLDPNWSKDQLKYKLTRQFEFNKISVKHIYSQSFPNDMILNLQDRQLLVDLYIDSGDSKFMVKPNTLGELRIYRANGNEVISTKKFMGILFK